jgi:hypothetical protein
MKRRRHAGALVPGTCDVLTAHRFLHPIGSGCSPVQSQLSSSHHTRSGMHASSTRAGPGTMGSSAGTAVSACLGMRCRQRKGSSHFPVSTTHFSPRLCTVRLAGMYQHQQAVRLYSWPGRCRDARRGSKGGGRFPRPLPWPWGRRRRRGGKWPGSSIDRLARGQVLGSHRFKGRQRQGVVCCLHPINVVHLSLPQMVARPRQVALPSAGKREDLTVVRVYTSQHLSAFKLLVIDAHEQLCRPRLSWQHVSIYINVASDVPNFFLYFSLALMRSCP